MGQNPASSTQADATVGGTPARPVVLFVDDEQRILNTMRIMFRRHYEVLTASGGEEALALIKERPVDVLVSDQRMPGMSGFELLREARHVRPGAMRILLTGYSDLNAIVGSINEGEIFRYINKPWANDHLQSVVAQAAETARDITVMDKAELLASSPDDHKQAAPQPPVRHENEPPPPILLLDDDRESVNHLRGILGDEYELHHASSIDAGLDLLQRHGIGVLVVETEVGGEGVAQLLGLLKQKHPAVVTVVLTGRSDADVAIRLINEGQIYRFLIKPARERMFKLALNSALLRHKTLLGNPNLNKRYQVEEKPKSEVSGKLMDRIGKIRILFGNNGAAA